MTPAPATVKYPPRFSVDSVLQSREVDPAELLMDLGFGGQTTDLLARIPVRFFQPSKVSCHLHVLEFAVTESSPMVEKEGDLSMT